MYDGVTAERETQKNMDKEELKKQVKLLFEIMSDETVVNSIAGMCWDIFNKLKEKGFTEEQALQLTIALNRQNSK